MAVVLATPASTVCVYRQLALKASQLTTYTRTEVDTLFGLTANKTYVYGQLALKANQITTYTKLEVYAALGLKAN